MSSDATSVSSTLDDDPIQHASGMEEEQVPSRLTMTDTILLFDRARPTALARGRRGTPVMLGATLLFLITLAACKSETSMNGTDTAATATVATDTGASHIDATTTDTSGTTSTTEVTSTAVVPSDPG